MRYIRKRLTVVNNGFTNRKKPAEKRIQIVINRYIEKMKNKGWEQYVPAATGNCFDKYEAYVFLRK